MTCVVQWLFHFKDCVPLRFTPSACATRMANLQRHLNVPPASKTYPHAEEKGCHYMLP